MDATEAAYGLAEVVDENMANAARVHAVENGEDLSEYTMIAFGGAAPLHAARLCEKLGVSRCLVPEGAGVGSAIGFLKAPFSFEANRSVFMTERSFDTDRVKALFAEMEEEAAWVCRSCDAEAQIVTDHKVYMRYRGKAGKSPCLTPEQAANPNAKELVALFEAEYQKLFSRVVDGMVAEITVWSVNATTVVQAPDRVDDAKALTEIEATQTRSLFDPALGRTADARVVDRAEMTKGARVSGPAVITERETTIIVPASREATASDDGTIHVYERADCPVAKAEETSRVAYQVMWNRLISVVEEQAQALVRTAFSTSVREAGDLSAGVYNDQGEMLAQAVTGTPGHVNAMADAVGHFIRRIGRETMAEGDVYLTNDPWEGTGHKHDITVVTPSFHQGKLIGFFACTAHVTDIGGRGFGADANDIHEEGLYLPIMRFAAKGEVDQTLLQIIRAMCGNLTNWSVTSLHLATCNEIGHRRLNRNDAGIRPC